MGKKLILFVLLLLVAIPLISSQPPFQQETGTENGLTLRFPPIDVVKINRDVTANMHVHNTTNGLRLTNSTVECFTHLYNTTGYHIINQEMEFDLDDGDFELEILGTNFSSAGVYSFIIWCNSSVGGGFVSGSVEATSTGYQLTTQRSIIYIGLLSILVFLFLTTVTGITLLPTSNTKDDEERIVSISNLKYLRSVLWVFLWALLMAIMFISSNLAFAYLGAEMMGKLFFSIYTVMFAVSIPALLIWGLYFFVRIIEDKKLKAMIERGVGGTL